MCDSCDWEFYLRNMEDIFEERKLSKSDRAYIEGVYEWVEEHEHITDGQKYYVDKIESKTSK